MHRLRSFGVLIAVLLLMLGACRFGPEKDDVLPAPYQLRSSVPGDSVTNTALEAILLQFNRKASPEEFQLRLVPHGQIGRVSTSAGGAFLKLDDVSLWSDVLSHRLLIDGPHVLHPYLLRLYSGDAGPDAVAQDPFGCFLVGELGYIGRASGHAFLRGVNIDPQYTVIIAIHASSLDPGISPYQLFEKEPREIALADFERGEQRYYYAFENLRLYEDYAILGVHDTSGDGQYDPDEDWWGFWGAEAGAGSVTLVAAGTSACQPIDIDVELRPPGTYDRLKPLPVLRSTADE